MLRIALCDDDLNFMRELHKKIMQWYQDTGYGGNISVTEFSDSLYLARTVSGGSSFDLLFVDIEMPQLNGLELAGRIRTYLPAAMIVFLTSHSEFSCEGYKFGALRYIPKLDLDRQLPEALAASQTEFAKLEKKFLTVRRYSDVIRIPYEEIVYIRHMLRSSQIITLSLGTIQDNRGLKAIHEQLNDDRFIYIDRSTFVNLDHVRQIKGNEMILRNMVRLPISRQMLTKVKCTINRMWGDLVMRYFNLLEWTATFVENLVLLGTVTAVSGRRYQKSRHYPAMLLSTVCLTVLVSILNYISAFSFYTPTISMCFIILILSRITSTGPLLIRSTACIMVYFVVLTIDYILFVLSGVLLGWSENTFPILMAPGIPRAIVLIISKSTDVLAYFLIRRFLPGICALKKKYQLVLLLVCLTAYITTQYLFDAFLYSERDTLYRILIFSWMYILFFVAIVIIALILITKSQQEKQTHMLLKRTNQLLTENYQQLHAFQQKHAKQIHDFNHHLTVLKGLEANGKHAEVSEYMNSLLSTTYKEAALCHSGSDIIDAIINYKAAEAEQLGIVFSFTADFHIPTNIDPIDICGALANQIDNAFDACRNMPISDFREVKVIIKQVENFVFFRVENTVDCDPFENNQSLISTKTDMSMQHGLGLKNIRDIADKYSGFLRSEYKDGFFISVVSLCYEPLDT